MKSWISKKVKGKAGTSSADQEVAVTREDPLLQFKTFLSACGSAILNENELRFMASWFPEHTTIRKPHLVYSSEESGSCYTTLCRQAGCQAETLLIVKAALELEEVHKKIFGFFLSGASWSQAINNGPSVGNGESFIFMLREGNLEKYGWDPTQSQTILSLSNKNICIGAVAIWINEELTVARIDQCKTFGNPVFADGNVMTIIKIELVGFKSEEEENE